MLELGENLKVFSIRSVMFPVSEVIPPAHFPVPMLLDTSRLPQVVL